MGESRYHRCGGCKQMLDGSEYPIGSSCPHCSTKQTKDDFDGKYRGARPQAFDDVLLKSEFDGIERTVAKSKKISFASLAKQSSTKEIIRAILLAACFPALLFIVNPMVYKAFVEPVFNQAIYIDDHREALASFKMHVDSTGETPGGEANTHVLAQAESTMDDVLALLRNGIWITRAVGVLSGAFAGVAFGALLLFAMHPSRSKFAANMAACLVLVALLGVNGSVIRYRVASETDGFEYYRPAISGMLGFLTAGAILDRKISFVEMHLREGAPLDFLDQNGAGYLHFAAEANAVEAIEPLLGDDRLVVDSEDSNGDTALVYAVRGGHTEMAHALILKGADWRRAEDGPQSLIHLAAAQEDVGLLELLLKYEASPNRLDSDGRTPLMVAAAQGNNAGLGLLLERDADVDLAGNGQLCLLEQTLARVLEQLETAKRRVNWDDIDGADRLALLLEHGADANQRDSNGLTPLHRLRYAIEESVAKDENLLAFGRVADMLLSHGADATAEDPSGHAAYRLADAAAFGHVRWAKTVLENDPSALSEMDAAGRRPLQLAIENERTEFVRFLLENGADPIAWEPSTSTGLSFAVRTGQLDTTQLLLAYGLGPESTDTNWESPILIAAKRGDEKLVTLLLEHGFDANRQNPRGDTPLHLAVKAEDAATVRLLLSNDADPTLWNKAGDTPLRLARRTGDKEIIGALRRAGVQQSGGR